MIYWKPPVDKWLNFFDSYDSYLESLPEEGRKVSKMVKTHWPPDNVDQLHLDRWCVDLSLYSMEGPNTCISMRLYPHLQDTGGFFVAVLERAEFPSTGGRPHK